MTTAVAAPIQRWRLLCAMLVAGCAAMLVTGVAPADASMLLGTNYRNVQLKVNQRGNVALISANVRVNGRWQRRHILAWGAKDWPPNGRRFQLDRTGGWRTKGRYGRWQNFPNHCGRYRGPRIPWAVRRCSMRINGVWHHWAIQAWQRIKPNYGGTQGPVEWRLSHWTGNEIPRIRVWSDWTATRRCHGGQWHCLHIYGDYRYQDRPVVSREFTRLGYVLDGQGRNMALESFRPDYPSRPGWTRVNMFLAQDPLGQFCFIFGPKPHPNMRLAPWQVANLRRTGRSRVERYRMMAAGPGVLPDVVTNFRGRPLEFDQRIDDIRNAHRSELIPPEIGKCLID